MRPDVWGVRFIFTGSLQGPSCCSERRECTTADLSREQLNEEHLNHLIIACIRACSFVSTDKTCWEIPTRMTIVTRCVIEAIRGHRIYIP